MSVKNIYLYFIKLFTFFATILKLKFVDFRLILHDKKATRKLDLKQTCRKRYKNLSEDEKQKLTEYKRNKV